MVLRRAANRLLRLKPSPPPPSARVCRCGVASLRSTEEHYRLLVESVVDYGIYMLDPLGRVVSWNPGAERIKGYTAAEVTGEFYGKFYTPEDRAAGLPDRNLALALADGRFEGEGWRVRKDGSRFWAVVVIDAIHDERGVFIGFAKITRDATKRKEAEEALAAMREQMFEAQKMEAVSQVARGVAHDFNNMLAVVLGSLELLERRYAGVPGAEALVKRATSAGERGALLVQQLLTFCRQAKLAPKVMQIDLVGIQPLLSSTLGDHIGLVVQQPADLWSTEIDVVQFHAALLNLCLNARDAIPKKERGSVTIRASNQARQEGDCVLIEFTDSGAGMPSDVKAKAFEPFFTTKGPRHSGLGLSQVQGFVHQSNGSVTLQSTEGQGTTASIYLRRVDAP